MVFKAMIDEEEQQITETDAVSDAIKGLTTAQTTQRGKDSEVELKTDLDINEVKGHAILSVLNKFIELEPKDFSEKCIIGELIDKKERKAWSKNRLSRSEIVQIARQPELPRDMQNDIRKQGLFSRLFTPKQRQI